MLKVKLLFFVFLIPLIGTSQTTWNKNFGPDGHNDEKAFSIEFVNGQIYVFNRDWDGNLINGNSAHKTSILHLNLNGDSLNMVTFDYSDDFTSNVLWGNNNSDYNGTDKFVVSTCPTDKDTSLTSWQHYGEVMLLDLNLDTIWTKRIGGAEYNTDLFQSRFINNDEIVVVGVSQIIGEKAKVLVSKLDIDGNIIWTKRHLSLAQYNNSARSIVQDSDGNFLVGGASRIGDGDSYIQLLMKLDPEGNLISYELGAEPSIAAIYAQLEYCADGNFIFGSTRVYEGDDHNYFYIAKIDSEMNVLWENEFNYYEKSGYILQIKENEDGSFIAVGNCTVASTLENYGTIMKFDPEGELIWYRQYQHATDDIIWNRLYDVVEIPGDGWVACGTRLSMNDDIRTDHWVIKVDQEGCLVPGCGSVDQVQSQGDSDQIEYFICGPNPASSLLNVYVGSNVPSGTELIIQDLNGKRMNQFQNFQTDITFMIDVSAYTFGNYSLNLVHNGRILQSEKLIIGH